MRARASRAMGERSGKRSRLDIVAQSLGISLTQADRMMRDLAGTESKGNLHRSLAHELDVDTPSGSLLRYMEFALADGKCYKLLYVHPVAWLQELCRRWPTFADLLFSSIGGVRDQSRALHGRAHRWQPLEPRPDPRSAMHLAWQSATIPIPNECYVMFRGAQDGTKTAQDCPRTAPKTGCRPSLLGGIVRGVGGLDCGPASIMVEIPFIWMVHVWIRAMHSAGRNKRRFVIDCWQGFKRVLWYG